MQKKRREKKRNSNFTSHLITLIQLITALNIKFCKTIELLEENTGGNFCDFGLSKEFLHIIPTA